MKIPNSALETKFFNYRGRRYVKDSVWSSEKEAENKAGKLRKEGFLAVVVYSACGTIYNLRGSCHIVYKVFPKLGGNRV